MKAIKKILAILVCVCVVCSCGILAASAEIPGSITIKNPTNSEATVAGKTFHIYKVFNASISGTKTAYSWYEDEHGNIPFYDYFYGPTGKLGVNVVNGDVQAAVDYVRQRNTNNLEFSLFAEELYEYVKTVGFFKQIPAAAAGTTQVTVDELGYGYFLVYDATPDVDGTSAVRSAVMLTDNNVNPVITLKANRPQVSKTVRENNGVYGEATSSAIGETNSFKISSLIPSHNLYPSYTYIIEDQIPEWLELKQDTVKVYIGSELIDYEAVDSLVDVEYVGGKLTVDLTDALSKKESDIFKYAIGTEIRVEYDAVVNNKIKAFDANENVAVLKYSNDPMDADSTGNTSDSAMVYTYTMVLTKYATDTSGVFSQHTRLAGATFNIFDEGNNPVYFTYDDVNKKYIVSDSANGSVDITVSNVDVTDNAAKDKTYVADLGDIILFGLKEGKYTIKETVAPDGYIAANGDFYVEINDTIDGYGAVSDLTVTYGATGNAAPYIGGIDKNVDDLMVWAGIANKPGTALPDTGGMGTAIFTIFGVVLMAGAIAFFTSRKRSSMA